MSINLDLQNWHDVSFPSPPTSALLQMMNRSAIQEDERSSNMKSFQPIFFSEEQQQMLSFSTDSHKVPQLNQFYNNLASHCINPNFTGTLFFLLFYYCFNLFIHIGIFWIFIVSIASINTIIFIEKEKKFSLWYAKLEINIRKQDCFSNVIFFNEVNLFYFYEKIIYSRTNKYSHLMEWDKHWNHIFLFSLLKIFSFSIWLNPKKNYTLILYPTRKLVDMPSCCHCYVLCFFYKFIFD